MFTKGPWEVREHTHGGILNQLWICGPKPPLITRLNIDMKPHDQQANAKLIASAPTLYDIVASLAERDCEYTGSAGCDMLPQGVKRRVCLPCKARMIISELTT